MFDSLKSLLPYPSAKKIDRIVQAFLKGPESSEWDMLKWLSPEARFNVAKKIAESEGTEISRYVAEFRIKDPVRLCEIATIAAVNGDRYLGRYIKDYKINDPDRLYELAKILLLKKDVEGAFGLIDSVVDQEKLFNIAHLATLANPFEAADNFRKLGIKDPERQFFLAKLALECDSKDPRLPGYCIRFLSNYDQLNLEMRFELTKKAAALNGYAVSRYIQSCDISDPAMRFEIAKIAAIQDGVEVAGYIKIFSIISPSQLKTVFMLALEQNYESFEVFHSASRLFPERDCLKEKIIDIADWFQSLDSKYDTGLLACLAEVSGVETLPKALFLTEKYWDSLDKSSQVNLSRQALIKYAGIPLPEGNLSSDSRRKLYETILAARQPLADLVQIDQSAWQQCREQVLECILHISSLSSLGAIFPRFKLTASNVSNEKEMVVRLLSDVFARVMGLDKEKSNLPALFKKWGDLSPVIVLAGRYKTGDMFWQRELAVLQEIIRRALDGTFKDWKYDKSQLSMLKAVPTRSALFGFFKRLRSPLPQEFDRFDAWRLNHSSLRCHASQAGGSGNVFEDARGIYLNNLIRHIPPKIFEGSRALCVDDLLIDIPDKDFAKKHSLTTAVAVIKYLLDIEDRKRLKEFLGKFNSAKAILLSDVEPQLARQIGEDLKSIAQIITPQKNELGTKYLVFSTITDDPKLLLIIGDLVNSSSCQNYKTGIRVDTLPAYVMDGNIKAILSFPIAWRVIQNAFGVNVKAEDLSYEFDAPRLELKLSFGDKQEIILLDKAIRRSIIRLGTAESGQPGLLIEKPYQQTHAVMLQIKNQESELIALLRQGIRAELDCKMTFPVSRNPAGVYSDLCGGVQKGKYSY